MQGPDIIFSVDARLYVVIVVEYLFTVVLV